MGLNVFVVPGAAVWPGGAPSNAMRRRVEGAILSADGAEDAIFLLTGGVGRYPPSEARVMRHLLLEEGIAPERILLDEASSDTLESVRNCRRIIAGLSDVSRVIICTDRYHVFRLRWLFFLSGIRTAAGRVPSGRKQNGIGKWLFYYCREIPATIWDTFLIVAFRES